LRVGNPVAIVVSCEERLFLAVAQVNDIKLASAAVMSIALNMLLNSSAKISVQILCLVPATVIDDLTKKNDWCWSFLMEAACSDNCRRKRKADIPFQFPILAHCTATIHGQMLPANFFLVTKVKQTSAFPYRRGGESSCFLVEHDDTERQGPELTDPSICSSCVKRVVMCPNGVHNGQHALEHMRAHLLFDPVYTYNPSVQQACGACLAPFPQCTLYFKPRRGVGVARQVDWACLTCRRGKSFTFNMATASVSSSADSPCSNRPVQCSLCNENSPLAWTYSLEVHWRVHHNRTVGPFTFRSDNRNETPIVYKISDQERDWMKAKWNQCFTVVQAINTTAKLKGKGLLPLIISEAHSSRMALRCALQPSQIFECN
ncbi:hypothetical protein DFH07DRAFT_741355, partial [Mycena maculata]